MFSLLSFFLSRLDIKQSPSLEKNIIRFIFKLGCHRSSDESIHLCNFLVNANDLRA